MKNVILMGILIVCLIPLRGSIIDMNLIKSLEICKEIDTLHRSKFSISNLKRYLELKGVQHPEVVIRQAIVESGWGKSKVFQSNKNLFGMRHPKTRATTSQGSRHNYAVYKSWTDSIDDYLIWQNIRYHGGDYYAFLIKTGYCTSSGYVNLLKKIKIKV
jgi:hypothetical protein